MSLHHICRVVDDEGVVACAAYHRGDACSRNKRVVASIGGDEVVEGVAGQGDRRRSGAGQILHVGGCRVAHGGLDGVDIRTGRLRQYDVINVVDDEGVGADSADQRGYTSTGNQGVVAAVGGNGIAGSLS